MGACGEDSCKIFKSIFSGKNDSPLKPHLNAYLTPSLPFPVILMPLCKLKPSIRVVFRRNKCEPNLMRKFSHFIKTKYILIFGVDIRVIEIRSKLKIFFKQIYCMW